MLGGGWPAGVLIEVLLAARSHGELELLLPALASITRGDCGGLPSQQGRVMFISPPWIPYAPALATAGMEISRVVLVAPPRSRDTLWGMEQALASGACAAVIAWAGAVGRTLLRRLQLAAERSRCWTILVRPARFRSERSPAALRLQLDGRGNAGAGLVVEVFRNRFGRTGAMFVDSHCWAIVPG